jgi:hypothetical protein
MPETIIRLLGLVSGLHGLAKYADWKFQLSGFYWFSTERTSPEPPTYLDVWVLLPFHYVDWQHLAWVLCGMVLIRFSKQIAGMLSRRPS